MNSTSVSGMHPTTHHRSGWVSFAGFLMIVAGIFQAIMGLVAIFKSDLFVVTANHLIVLDYTQWGWVHLIFGILLLFASAALFAGRLWGRVVAITLATFSAILNFGFIQAYPIWSIMIIVLDIVIIYSVAMYGSETE
jgi:hypothetical protein